MTKSFKKIISITIALAMVVLTPVTAFAKDWYLENGDILISANESGQTVTQGGVTEEDDAPVITHDPDGTLWVYDVQVKVETEGDAVAEFTIKDINVENLDYEGDRSLSTIDIRDSKAEITVEGENIICNENEDGYSAIHVGGGELTIKGDGFLDIYADSHGAKIGSDQYEEMSGTIHITDDVSIYTENDGTGDSAAIGSGEGADFTGKIQIDGNAKVTAVANDRGAGIGSGEGDTIYDEYENEIGWGGDFRGEIIIGGYSEVYAEGNDDSAGIGSGEDGTFSGGSITIKDNAKVEAIGKDEGPGIGAADDTPLDGDIVIKDNAEVKASSGSEDTPDIGSEGGVGGDKGSISILGNAKVDTTMIPKLDENGDPVYDENDNRVMIRDETLKIGGEYPEGEEDEEYYPFEGEIRIGSNTTIGGIQGRELLENPEEYGDYIMLHAVEENIVQGNDNNFEDYLNGIFDLFLKNGKPSGSSEGIKDIVPEEESNPNTGAPVIMMDAPNVVFVPVAVTAKKRED